MAVGCGPEPVRLWWLLLLPRRPRAHATQRTVAVPFALTPPARFAAGSLVAVRPPSLHRKMHDVHITCIQAVPALNFLRTGKNLGPFIHYLVLQKSKNLKKILSNRILRHMHKALNIVKIKTNYTIGL